MSNSQEKVQPAAHTKKEKKKVKELLIGISISAFKNFSYFKDRVAVVLKVPFLLISAR